MRLIDHLQARGAQRALAAQLNIPPVLISQWANDRRPIPAERCVEIEQATKGAVTRKDLRPDDWHRIWPELVEATT
jgi:DNA-binding transcriptional regulator YdaS (Cro superfamily)